MNKDNLVQGTQIEKAGEGSIQWVNGPKQNFVSHVLPPEKSTAQTMVFVSTPSQFELAKQNLAPIIIAHDSCLQDTAVFPENILLFKTKNISRAMSAVLSLFDTKSSRFDWETPFHSSAVIHPTAQIGKNVRVGPLAVIGPQVKIGDHSTIGAGAVIEKAAQIGQRTLIHSQVFIGSRCEIGHDCEIHPHTSIGSDGFGFATDEKFKHHKIPQLGKVVIEDQVEIGANCAIDRATLTETRIRSGSKFDNFCHVAHNCDLGENCLFAAGFFIAGSSKIGSRFMCGGNVAVTTHVELTDGVILAGRSTVTNHVTEPGQYGGYPLQPLKEALKTLANLGHLTDLRKSVSKILKHLQIPEEK